MNLRPYQIEARDAVLSEWQGGRARTLLVLPTGTGKTIVFSAVIAERVAAGERVLVLAHRGELLDQAADKLRKSTGLMCAVEKAEESCLGSWFRVVVGSVQTLMRPQRLAQFPAGYFGTIIIDEAHHCLSDSYQRVLEHFGGANVLGVTATPDRSDMRNLGQYFDSLAYEYTLPKAIREGYLSPIKALTVPLRLDISQVGVAAGDYKAAELGTALEPYLEQIAYQMQNYCRGRRTVVFLPLVATSQKFRDILQSHGFRAAEVNGNSADRAEVLADFAAGKPKFFETVYGLVDRGEGAKSLQEQLAGIREQYEEYFTPADPNPTPGNPKPAPTVVLPTGGNPAPGAKLTLAEAMKRANAGEKIDVGMIGK